MRGLALPLLALAACAHAGAPRREIDAKLAEINADLSRYPSTIVLTTGARLEAAEVKLGLEATYWRPLDQQPPERLPTLDIQEISYNKRWIGVLQGLGVGAGLGLGAGLLTGFAIGGDDSGFGVSSGAKATLFGILLATAGAATGAVVGAIRGSEETVYIATGPD